MSELQPDTYGEHTAAIKTPEASVPVLSVQGAQAQRFELTKAQMSLGRAPDNDIRIDQPEISRFHALITIRDSSLLLSDLGSRNGTYVNGNQVRGTIELQEGDRIEFGDVEASIQNGPAPEQVASKPPEDAPLRVDRGSKTALEHQFPRAFLVGADGAVIALVKDDTLIGRVPGNDLVLSDPYVSRQNAKIQRQGDIFTLSDLDSSNGSYVNGERLTGPHVLHPDDEIRIGRTVFQFQRLIHEGARGTVAAFPVSRTLGSTGGTSIEIDGVLKNYQSGDGEVPVLRGVSLTIRRGEFVSLVGPSGSGKSTLINVMTGIDRPDGGRVVINGQDLGGLSEDKLARWRGKTIGLIFQFFQLLPTLTAMENVLLPMDFCKTYPSNKRRGRALECLSLVGMDRYSDRLPSALSGGQQQRVAIARALANDPPIIVGDEPTGNLDSATAQQVFSLLGRLAEEGKTVVFVTHDPLLARSTPRKVEILDGQTVNEDLSAAPAAVVMGR